MGVGSSIYMHVSPKRWKIGGKLVLIINRKSYMSFRLVPKSVTLNDLVFLQLLELLLFLMRLRCRQWKRTTRLWSKCAS